MDMIDMMNIVLQICQIVSGLSSAVAIIISITIYRHGLNQERKINTLNSLSEIRRNYFNTKKLNTEEKLHYINELEYFSTGVNQKIYDVKIVKKMSGSRLIRQYENWSADFIEKRREDSGNNNAYYEYEKMIKKLKKL